MCTSKQLVYDTLNFNNPKRVPRQLWVLPWAENNYPQELKKINNDFPTDFGGCSDCFKTLPKTIGNPYAIGKYVDEWGCEFTNRQEGVIGEVKKPIIIDEEWEDSDKIHIPVEFLNIKKDNINNYCKNTDKFVMASTCPRPFERLQFLRGTEQLYIDLMLRPSGMFEFIEELHNYYCELLENWAQTDVDALSFMDDWGAQRSLLINSTIWVEIFKPMYKDFIDIAHKHNKKIFMHSDGYILEILPHLIDLGLDAINCQIFCMGVNKLKQFKGKITFWGEIDRQHLLPYGSLSDIENAVKSVYENLWQNGGCIAQCEFGPGAKPENVYNVFETWNNIMEPLD